MNVLGFIIALANIDIYCLCSHMTVEPTGYFRDVEEPLPGPITDCGSSVTICRQIASYIEIYGREF